MKSNRESGQAIVEMAIGLFAIMVVFSGLLYVAALGNDSIECLLDANRQAAVAYAGGKTGGNDGTAISTWDSGNDKVLYSHDDVAVASDAGDVSVFNQQLNPTESTDLESKYYVSEIFSKHDYVYYRDFTTLPMDNFFVRLASLNQYYSNNNNSLKDRGLADLENSFRTLFGTSGDFTITETVYYPDAQ